MLGIESKTNPFLTAAHPSGKLKLKAAPGISEHLEATLELLASGDHYNITLHDKHKKNHGITDKFDQAEIDHIAAARNIAKIQRTKDLNNQNRSKNEKGLPGKRQEN